MSRSARSSPYLAHCGRGARIGATSSRRRLRPSRLSRRCAPADNTLTSSSTRSHEPTARVMAGEDPCSRASRIVLSAHTTQRNSRGLSAFASAFFLKKPSRDVARRCVNIRPSFSRGGPPPSVTSATGVPRARSPRMSHPTRAREPGWCRGHSIHTRRCLGDRDTVNSTCLTLSELGVSIRPKRAGGPR